MSWSGTEDIFNVLPSCPVCPPGSLPLDPRRLTVFRGRFSSLEGGTELLPLFFLGVLNNLLSSKRFPMVWLSLIMVAFKSDIICPNAASEAILATRSCCRRSINFRSSLLSINSKKAVYIAEIQGKTIKVIQWNVHKWQLYLENLFWREKQLSGENETCF